MAKILGFTQRSSSANRASTYYWGRQYENLFDWDTNAEVELRQRKPSVRVRLTKKAVDEIVAHLFGEDRGPSFSVATSGAAGETSDAQRTELDRLETRVQQLHESSRLAAWQPEIGRLGNLHGTVAVAFHSYEGTFSIELLNAPDARPTFGYEDRARAVELGVDLDDLLELDEYWREYDEQITGETIETMHRRLWTPDATIEYVPNDITGQEDLTLDDLKWVEDDERSTVHDLGFVPVEWIQNLPVAHDVDGRPAVDDAEFAIEDELNYTLSQTGRGIRYNQEPQLVFTNVSNLDDGTEDREPDAVKRGAKNTLTIEADPVTKLPVGVEVLELSGSGQSVAMEYADQLRGFFYEMTNVVIHDPDRFAGALSGVALKRLLRPMIAFVGMERPQYGAGLARLLAKMLRAEEGEQYVVTANWPDVVELTTDELLQVVTAAREAYNAGLVTLKTAVELVAPLVGIDDVAGYMNELAAENGQSTPGDDGSSRLFGRIENDLRGQ